MLDWLYKDFDNYFICFWLFNITFIVAAIAFIFLFIPVKNIFFKLINLIIFIGMHILLTIHLFVLFAIVSAVMRLILFVFCLCFLTLNISWLIIIYEKCNPYTFTNIFLKKFVNNKILRTTIYIVFITLALIFIAITYTPIFDMLNGKMTMLIGCALLGLHYASLHLWVKLKKSQNLFWIKLKKFIIRLYIVMCIVAASIILLVSFH